MAIGIDENFEDENVDIDDDLSTEQTEQQEQQPDTSDEDAKNDLVSSLLKDRGIEDKSKIKFENEDGQVEEVDWNNLNDQDKLNILRSSEEQPETGLDDSEINLINAIRTSGMTPQEYLNYIGNYAAQSYAQQEPQYQVDNYSDDELFLMDFMSRMGDVTDDEALEALDRAKANDGLFRKQIDAIRNEYKQAENENLMQQQLEQEQMQQEQFQEFSNQIVNEINNLTEFEGYDLNLGDEDMQILYDFITGTDAAGNNYFAKTLADPQTLVKTAWLTLNGEQMINDITRYFQNEITNVRKTS